MKKLSALTIALLLAGCASMPRPHMMASPYKAPIAKVAPVPAVEPATPNVVVKKRWSWPHPKWKLMHQ